jgi:hypothetical protein
MYLILLPSGEEINRPRLKTYANTNSWLGVVDGSAHGTIPYIGLHVFPQFFLIAVYFCSYVKLSLPSIFVLMCNTVSCISYDQCPFGAW